MTRSGKTILFVAHTDNLKGGGELSLIELIKSAKKRGYSVQVVVPNLGEFSSQAERAGAKCLAKRYYYWGRQASAYESHVNLEAVQFIADLITQNKIDCVITNTLMVPWGALAAALANVPHAWIAREFLVHQHAHLEAKYQFIDQFSNLVIANSRSNADYISSKLTSQKAKSFYSFVDTSDLQLDKTKEDTSLVCIATRIYHIKNQLELLRAAAILKQHYKLKPKIVLTGSFDPDDEYYNSIKNFITEHQLAGQVRFTGFKSEPLKEVGPNDIIIQPSKNESLGRVMTEAMKLGLICVGADIAGTVEAFEVGGGNLYKAGDHKDLARLLHDITSNIDKYKAKAKLGQQQALKNLSETASHQPFFNELEAVISQPNPRRELQQISDLFAAPKYYNDTINNFQQLAQRRQDAIDNIVNSRAWKVGSSLQDMSFRLRKISKLDFKPTKKDK